MTRILLSSALVSIAMSFLSLPAHAGLFRAYVSSTGNDANACTLQAPCRLLPAALAAVNDGGEIWMLDSANYNTATVNIVQSVSILAVPGAVGSVLAVNGPAIYILGNPNLTVTVALRNLVIVPLPGGNGTHGVDVGANSTVTIENSLIANLPSDGVAVFGAGNIAIANTIIRNNGLFGVELQQGATADISGTELLNNRYGAVVLISNGATTTTATLSDSTIYGGSGSEGVYAITYSAGDKASIFVTRCTIQNTYFALDSETSGGGSALVAVSNSMITNNNYAWYQSGAGSVIRSLGNNHLIDNTTQSGTLTTTATQ